MATSARYPGATWEPVDYIGEAGPLITPLGWVEHVVVGNGDPFGCFQGAVPPNRRFSHLWFGKSGAVKQYQRLDRASWAQGPDGNSHYWSCETEGYPGEALTGAQLDALAAWHVWSGTPDRLAEAPGQVGIAWHGMGGDLWGGHPDCPGQIRRAQRADIIRRAQAIRAGGADMPSLDITDADTVWERTYTYGPEKTSPLQMLRETTLALRALSPAAVAAAVAKALPAGSSVDPQAVADAVVADLAGRLQS